MEMFLKVVLFVYFMLVTRGNGYEHLSCIPSSSIFPREKEVLQGPPGKSGPKGDKGDSGLLQVDTIELTKLKQDMTTVMSRLTVSEEKINNLEKEVEMHEIRALSEIPETCRDVYPRVNGTKLVKPNLGLPAFAVDCEFTDHEVITTVHHDSEMEVKATPACEPNLCYERNVVYQATWQQLSSIKYFSSGCSQHFKYKCKGAKLIHNGHSAWRSPDNQLHRYFAGDGSVDTCACGIRGDCINNAFTCNCDNNDENIITYDQGHLTNRDHLPVRTILLSDLGAESEKGWHTLGPFVCKQSL